MFCVNNVRYSDKIQNLIEGAMKFFVISAFIVKLLSFRGLAYIWYVRYYKLFNTKPVYVLIALYQKNSPVIALGEVFILCLLLF